MTQDFKLAGPSGFFDLILDGAEFGTVDGLETAIVISLFTDARAKASQVKSPDRRRGWVGNILNIETGRQLGSRLWVYDQSRLTPDIMNAVAEEAKRCLFWMVQDGVARSINAGVEKISERAINIVIDIVTASGENRRYELLWRSTGAL